MTKADYARATQSDRPCTCHPDDNPPRPCPKKYALSECLAAASQPAPAQEPVATLHDDGYFTWKSNDLRLRYDPNPRAGWRMDVYAAPPPDEARDAARLDYLIRNAYSGHNNELLEPFAVGLVIGGKVEWPDDVRVAPIDAAIDRERGQ